MHYYILFTLLFFSRLFSEDGENIAVDSLKFNSYILSSSFNSINLFPPVSHYNSSKQLGEFQFPKVKFYLSGSLDLNGNLTFEEDDRIITTNLRENKSWDLEIEQHQSYRFDVHL